MPIRYRIFFKIPCFLWAFLVCYVVSSGSVLKESSSTVSRLLFSSDYIPFSSTLFLTPLIFLFFFWLGSATDHVLHTPCYPLSVHRLRFVPNSNMGSVLSQVEYLLLLLSVPYSYFFFVAFELRRLRAFNIYRRNSKTEKHV